MVQYELNTKRLREEMPLLYHALNEADASASAAGIDDATLLIPEDLWDMLFSRGYIRKRDEVLDARQQ
jgi:hypothetical protein